MEYITISKFAEKAGVTPQAIYKRLTTDLAPYLKVENGVKLLNEDGLELYTEKQLVKQSVQEKLLQEEVERLKAELESKQLLINELYRQKDELNEKMLDILDKQTSQFQQLLAFQQNGFQQLVSALQPPKEVETNKPTVEMVEQPVDNPSLLRRLFPRRNKAK